MPQGVYIEGLRETVRSLERMGTEVADLKEAFTKIGNNVVQEARTLVPVKSGRLEASIKASKTKNKSVIRAGGARIPYAGVIHYGWPAHGISPHPFMTDAISNKQQETVQLLESEIHKLINRLDLAD